MPVQNAAALVGYGVAHIIAIDKHREKRRYRAFALFFARALHKLRQKAQNARRIALCRGRFAKRKPYFSLCHRKARNRVHYKKHIFALLFKKLRHAHRAKCAVFSHKRAVIACGDYDNRVIKLAA